LLACTFIGTPIVCPSIHAAKGSALHSLLVYLLQLMRC